ncbi:hypothetical protein [Psychroserpens sp. SPM9]|uniref:hypothetical protein n=1 Tax=Psychroserpens sp. SPM9 TaxID=2975598 RepID=UPI0021A466AC|nr:hypothetical protein [Psychroserpens sp. SPM9]MDG5489927.1 hypothetical protein [Psychroserpens sp. SPM9]
MKHYLFLFASLFLLTSCNFTEEITFNEDGSGEFIMSYDMSEVMRTMEEQMGGGNKKEGKEKVKIDSVFYFNDMLVEKADSIAQLPQEEQDRIKSLEDIVMKMKMDEEKGVFNIGVGSKFKSLAELPEALEKIEQAKSFNSANDQTMSKMGDSEVAKASQGMFEYLDFTYDGKTFSRRLKEDYKDSNQDLEGLNNEIAQMGEESKEMFQSMSYTLVYNFPKPVKSVTNENAKISNDGKTVTLSMNFIEMLKTPEMMTLDVVLED